MQEVSACPDRAVLERFLLGQSSSADAEALEAHLERCDTCVDALNTLQARDSVIDAIRCRNDITGQAASVAVERLAERIKQLRPASPSHERTAASQPATLSRWTPGATQGTGTIGDDTAEMYDFLAPAVDPNELGCLGHYRVRKVLGAGGMGVVFQAYDPQLDRLVALKAMLPTMAASASAKRRFLREARAAAAIKHDHIVTIYQVGEDRGAPFLAMELLEGESLHDRVLRKGRLPLEQTLRIGREIALALAAAHGRDLIHRDIKPGNIWLESRATAMEALPCAERVKLLDFGLARATAEDARLTQVGAIVGTPAYMAPEQFRGEPVDARCDLFSLGCVLYRMATGEQPFKGADSIATLMAVTTEAPRPPQELDPTLPPAFCALIMRLLAKQPEDRPSSAQAVVEAIGAIERGQDAGIAVAPRHTAAEARATHARRMSPRRRVPIAAAMMLVALFGAGGYLLGPTVVRWACNEGELVIEIDDPDIQAVIDQTSVTIRDRIKDRDYRIKPVPQPVTAGSYLLEVTEADGDLKLFAKEFTIVRGGNTKVRVTFDPKVLTAKTVVGTGKAPTEVYADATHGLTDVVDFREIAGASAKAFESWRAGLGDEFRLAMVSTRKGSGPTLFNALAVREKTPHLVRCLVELSGDAVEPTYRRLVDDNGYRPLALCRSPAPNERFPWAQTQLLIKDGMKFGSWFGSLPYVSDKVARNKADRHRATYLEAFSGRDGPIYDSIQVLDESRAWKAFYALSPDELIATMRSYELKAWRPDVIAPDWDGRHLRFMLVAVDNRDGVDWRFRMDMRLKQYEQESAKQKAGGLFPLAVVSYGDDADVKYAAIWVRYCAAGVAAPLSPAVDPQVQADRAVHAVSWSSTVAPQRCFADRARNLADVVDWRDLAGASLTELREWAAGLGPDFHVSSVADRRGAGPALFNAVAVREKNALPFRFFAGLDQEQNEQCWKRQSDDGFRPVNICSSPSPDRNAARLDTLIWVKDGTTPYNWGGTWESFRSGIAKWRDEGCRPTFLDGPSGPDDGPYRVVMPDDNRQWHGQYSVAADELVPTIEFYRRKGWRPDVLAPYWKENQLRFMLVTLENSEHVDWRFRMDMSLKQYRKESTEHKQRGLFPLTVVSYGNDADVQYAAIWVRYRVPDNGN